MRFPALMMRQSPLGFPVASLLGVSTLPLSLISESRIIANRWYTDSSIKGFSVPFVIAFSKALLLYVLEAINIDLHNRRRENAITLPTSFIIAKRAPIIDAARMAKLKKIISNNQFRPL